MKDRQPTKPGRAYIVPEDGGSPYYAVITMADEPTEEGTAPIKANLLTDQTEIAIWGNAADRKVNDALIRLLPWQRLLERSTAGSFSFTVPSGITKLGVLMVGGGGGGAGLMSMSSGYARYGFGGYSGEINQFTMDVTPGAVISGVVGAGGAGGSLDMGSNGGTSSFGSYTATGGSGGTYAYYLNSVYVLNSITTPLGGQVPDMAVGGAPDSVSPYGLQNAYVTPLGFSDSTISVGSLRNMFTVRNTSDLNGGKNVSAYNMFDLTDRHVYCGAGGASNPAQTAPQRARGSAGSGVSVSSASAVGGAATAPGDGGGGAFVVNYASSRTSVGGKGADGIIIIYGMEA